MCVQLADPGMLALSGHLWFWYCAISCLSRWHRISSLFGHGCTQPHASHNDASTLKAGTVVSCVLAESGCCIRCEVVEGRSSQRTRNPHPTQRCHNDYLMKLACAVRPSSQAACADEPNLSHPAEAASRLHQDGQLDVFRGSVYCSMQTCFFLNIFNLIRGQGSRRAAQKATHCKSAIFKMAPATAASAKLMLDMDVPSVTSTCAMHVRPWTWGFMCRPC